MAWDIHPRDADLGRTLDPLSNWTELSLVERYNLPSTWVLTGPASELSAFTPSMGCILDRDGVQVASGQVRTIQRRAEYGEDGRLQDTITLSFIEDGKELWSRLGQPDPAHTITSTPSTFSTAYDTRTGSREDLILDYIAANLGPAAAVTHRRLTSLSLPASLGRGGTTTRKARMDVLGELVAGLAEAANLRVRIVHDESTGTPRLRLRIDDVEDVSADVIFGSVDAARATGFITSWGYSIEDPQVTDAIAFSVGDKAARQVTRVNSAAAIALWNRRYEVLVDQSQTDDTSDITDALNDRLLEGETPTSIEFTVAPGGDISYRTDYHVGYRVGVELPGLPVEISDNTIREVTTTIRPEEPEEVSLVVGSPGAQTASTKQAARLNRALRRIALIERSR